MTAIRNDAHDQHKNAKVAVYRVDLVDDDQGNPAYNSRCQYNTGCCDRCHFGTTNRRVVPGVVAIQTLRERAGFIETGPFEVRIILTEEPVGGLTTDLISVTTAAGASGGSATAVVKGQTLNGFHAAVTAVTGRAEQDSELTVDVVDYTANVIRLLSVARTDCGLPEATGRDNLYHQYFATITPTPGHNGPIRVSVNQFDDQVIPQPNTYVPLSPQQVVATTLVGTN